MIPQITIEFIQTEQYQLSLNWPGTEIIRWFLGDNLLTVSQHWSGIWQPEKDDYLLSYEILTPHKLNPPRYQINLQTYLEQLGPNEINPDLKEDPYCPPSIKPDPCADSDDSLEPDIQIEWQDGWHPNYQYFIRLYWPDWIGAIINYHWGDKAIATFTVDTNRQNLLTNLEPGTHQLYLSWGSWQQVINLTIHDRYRNTCPPLAVSWHKASDGFTNDAVLEFKIDLEPELLSYYQYKLTGRREITDIWPGQPSTVINNLPSGDYQLTVIDLLSGSEQKTHIQLPFDKPSLELNITILNPNPWRGGTIIAQTKFYPGVDNWRWVITDQLGQRRAQRTTVEQTQVHWSDLASGQYEVQLIPEPREKWQIGFRNVSLNISSDLEAYWLPVIVNSDDLYVSGIAIRDGYYWLNPSHGAVNWEWCDDGSGNWQRLKLEEPNWLNRGDIWRLQNPWYQKPENWMTWVLFYQD